jgi:hypothetical protein
MPLSARGAALALAFSALGGCAETHLYSGLPPGEAATGFDERWHSAYLFGTSDNGRVYALDALCPQGWSEVSVEQDSLTTLLGLATLFLYTPSRVTVVCARDAADTRSKLELMPPEPRISK